MRLDDGMICPICEAGKLSAVRKDVPFEYKGHHCNVRNIRVFVCDTCGESLWDDKDERDLEKTLTDERRGIDGLLKSDEIRAIRKIFGMSQEQFAKSLGVGLKNFARYESGQATQGRAMDNLLRILRDYPYTLNSIDDEWQNCNSHKIEIMH